MNWTGMQSTASTKAFKVTYVGKYTDSGGR
jgi:hypothetical protein